MASPQYPLADRTLLVSGGSRGIGLAIAVGAARLGANAVLLAKTSQPHPRLPGTVHTAVDADVLTEAGITDLSRYGGGSDPKWDIFVDQP
jgi:NAD(P)-dependent dehydrogenase (short-subunit alcohol dehydrogenase family)